MWAGLVLASAAVRTWQGFKLLSCMGNEPTSKGVSLTDDPHTTEKL
jgi:hypothetical protein